MRDFKDLITNSIQRTWSHSSKAMYWSDKQVGQILMDITVIVDTELRMK